MTINKTDLTSLYAKGKELETAALIKEISKRNRVFVPEIDYTDPSKFARYGSAERYYVDSVDYILRTFPYDGSKAEKEEWYNDSSYLDRYMYEEEMPRTNGYINLSVNGWGTPIAGARGLYLSDSAEWIQFFGNVEDNIYDESKKQENNLLFGLENTVEFWLKKVDPGGSPIVDEEVILDVWNGVEHSASNHCRLTVGIQMSSKDFFINHMVNSIGTSGTTLSGASPIMDGTWHHYAFTFEHSGTALDVRVYMDKELVHSSSIAYVVSEEAEGRIGFVGAYATEEPAGGAGRGYCHLLGSLDELRFWKSVRSPRQIGRFYDMNLGGGGNTDSNFETHDLGVYFKFNEGITTYDEVDRRVLDYSGRMSNGLWQNYQGSAARSTSSAMVEGGFTTEEYQDLIVYEIHPDVVSLIEEKTKVGVAHDSSNPTCLYRNFPAWIVEEDRGTEAELEKLAQVMASYFDTLHLQIEKMAEAKSPEYSSVSDFGNVPIGQKLLASVGFVHPDFFTDATIFERFFGNNDQKKFEESINKVKEFVYKNIYKNISHIYKSKGTEKAFRNVLRCAGIGEEIVQLKMYSDNAEIDFSEEKTKPVTSKKKFVKFSHTDNHGATVYSLPAVSPDADENCYIPGLATTDHDYVPITVECEVVFPSLDHIHERTQCSVFGMHEVTASDSSPVWDATDVAMFQVFTVRNPTDPKFVKFRLESAGLGITPIETDYYEDVYSGTRWTFAVRFLNENYFRADLQSGSAGGTYKIEFYGVQQGFGEKLESFSKSETGILFATGQTFLNKPKRLYAGAHRTNFTGSIVGTTGYSDCDVGAVRYWLGYLDDEIVDAHASDPMNIGPGSPEKSFTIGQSGVGGLVPNMPWVEALVLNWTFDTNTSITGDEIDYVYDTSGGGANKAGRYGWMSDIVAYRYPAQGKFFVETTPDNCFSNEYIFTKRTKHPEDLSSLDTVYLKEDYELEKFQKGAVPKRHHFALEKSMSGVISESMMNFFGIASDIGQAFGEGVDRYRMDYKRLEKLRNRFFEKVENVPDLEKFVGYYKWIDDALGEMLRELIPVGSSFDGEISDVVESHALERHKYWSKFPNLKFEDRVVETCISDACDVGGEREEVTVESAMELADIRNKKFCTGTEDLELLPYNYQHEYEVISTGGARINNLWLRRQDGGPTYSSYTPSASDPRVIVDNPYAYTNGQYCYTPFYSDSDRGARTGVMTCRFSAPGDRLTSRGFLDREALELSPYNAMPWRNLAARRQLDKEWA